MKNLHIGKILAVLIVAIFITSTFAAILVFKGLENKEETKEKEYVLPAGVKSLTKTFSFSEPEIEEDEGLTFVKVEEADFQSMGDGRPAIPTSITTIELPFGTKILGLKYECSEPENIPISKKISYGSCSTLTEEDKGIYQSSEMYPSTFVSYHTGGGLSENEHVTFLNIRVNPVTYTPSENEIHFVKNVKVTVTYREPETALLREKQQYDFLIISTNEFTKNLQPLVDHKEKQNIKTKLVTVEEIYEEDKGRDEAEKIKYYIKKSIEELGIRSVLLVGGVDGQSTKWNLPARWSHVLIREGTQEIPEPEFISDLYFADIYDAEGNFSSWDTNNNDVFAEYEGKTIDQMDLYPDVNLGRLPCRNKKEVKTAVDKIIGYETNEPGDWFNKMILVSGDHWADKGHISEGVLIMEEAKEIMDGFVPVELYATEDNQLRVRDINKAITQGAGFAYFCGHGGSTAWGIHYPPDASGWGPSLGGLGLITFYKPIYMKFLRNKNKLPVTLVGGCNNGQFDISMGKSLERGKIKFNTGCWAWKLTIQKNGGSIATIANTGLGTHAMDDADNNKVNDYLEVYDGWLELKFFELYSQNNIGVLGELHQGAITNYLNMFLGNNDEMDIKMVQQWQLFGDPSIELCG